MPLLSKAPRAIRNRALPAVVAHPVVESYRAVVRGAPFKSGEVSNHGGIGRRIGYPQATEVRLSEGDTGVPDGSREEKPAPT